MKISSFVATGFLFTAATAAPAVDVRAEATTESAQNILQTDVLAALALANLVEYYLKNPYPNKKCTLQNAAVRREWSTFSTQEKENYIAAVQCMSNKAPKTPSNLAPGVRNRYDDFVATHINQTTSIHGTGNFLTWHRYFTWAYEQALRNECGYNGYQPYYNWPKYASNPLNSPVFDGSNTSMSGDGEHVYHPATCIPADSLCSIRLPPGNGGGCIKDGPFKNWTVNLGPVSPALKGIHPNPSFTGLDYNPRCLRRDISSAASNGYTKDSDVVALITQNPNPYWFTTNMQGNFPAGNLGVHTAGHYTVGGDPGGDLFVSPGDPYFFFHHAMIDRVFWTWQNSDIARRTYVATATVTLNNVPPSRNATLEDTFDLGVNAPQTTIRDTSSTLGGPFCYVYA